MQGGQQGPMTGGWTGAYPGPVPGAPARPLGTVFISHSSKDHGPALDLRDLLRQAGYRTWMAPDDVLVGGSWTEQIVNGIAESTHVVVLLSKSSVSSEHVAREVGLASEQHKPLVPIRLDPVHPTGSLRYLLQFVQRVDAFPPPLAQHWPVIAAALSGAAIASGATVGKRGDLPPWAPAVVAGTILVALVAVIGGFILLNAGKSGPTPSPSASTIAFVSPTPDLSTPSPSVPATPSPSVLTTPTAGTTAVPTETAGASATPVATSSPTPTGAPSPTSVETAPPTPEPTTGPTVPPGGETVGPGLGLGAVAQVFADDFSTKTHWGTSTDYLGSSEYIPGGFQFTIAEPGHSRWSWAKVPLPQTAMRVVATVHLGTGSPSGSVMCGNSSNNFFFGLIGSNGVWYIGSLINKTFLDITNGPLPTGTKPDANGQARVSLECAVTAPGGKNRLRLTINDIVVADEVVGTDLGPYVDAGLEGEGSTPSPSVVSFTDLVVYGGDTYSDPGAALMKHVFVDYRPDCAAQTPAPVAGQVAAVQCAPAGKADTAHYEQYDSLSNMDAAFAEMLPQNLPGTDCSQGPGKQGYSLSGVHAGDLACFADPKNASGVQFAWTDEQLNILSTATLASGDYGTLHKWWLSADSGPMR